MIGSAILAKAPTFVFMTLANIRLIAQKERRKKCIASLSISWRRNMYVAENPITEGQDVFIVGLFIEYSGKKQSQPVLRFGNISLMPREKVDVFLSDEDKQEYTDN